MIDYLMVRKSDCCLMKNMDGISSDEHQIIMDRLLPMNPLKKIQVCLKAQSLEGKG